MKHYEVVCALIEDEKGRIFCCKRGPGRALEGKWEFPGGKVEKEETHEKSILVYLHMNIIILSRLMILELPYMLINAN